MSDYKEKAENICAWDMCCGLPNCASCQEIAAFGRQCAAEAYEDAKETAQREANACEHHALASKGSSKNIHLAARGVAKVIAMFCERKAAALRALGQEVKDGREK